MAGASMLFVCVAVTWLCGAHVTATQKEGTAIGIDFGDSYVRVGVFHNGQVQILKNDQGSERTPSYVAFTPEGHRLIGDEAKSQLTSNPRNTVFSVLALMGRQFDYVVEQHIKQVPYFVYESSKYPLIEVPVGNHTEIFAPEEIAAMLLRKMKQIAEKHLNKTVTDAVVSVSSCSRYVTMRAMRDAGDIAGLRVRVTNSRMSAAIAYHLSRVQQLGSPELASLEHSSSLFPDEKTLLLVELGATSFSGSVVSMKGKDITTIQATILTCNPDAGMFEALVNEYTMKLFEQRHGKALTNKLRQDTRAVWKLRREVEAAIRKLSSAELAYVDIESLIAGVDFFQALPGARFEKLTEDIVEVSLQTLRDTLVYKKKYKIHEIIIFGGSSLNPKVRQKIMTYFGISESKFNFDVDTLSVIGAAVHAARGISAGQTESGVLGYSASDICSIGIGYKGVDGFLGIISRTTLPAEAAGTAPIQGDENDMLSSAVVKVVEGDGYGFSNVYIGDAIIVFPPTRAARVEFTFRLDINFVLTVELVQKKSRTENSIVFDHRLSQSERAKMRNRLNALDDKEMTEAKRVQARDELESLAYLMVRHSVSDKAGLIRRTALEVIEWLDSNNGAAADEFSKMTKLLTDVQKLHQ